MVWQAHAPDPQRRIEEWNVGAAVAAAISLLRISTTDGSGKARSIFSRNDEAGGAAVFAHDDAWGAALFDREQALKCLHGCRYFHCSFLC